MTQDSLHRFRVDSCLVHQPVAQRVTKVMKPEPLTIMDLYPGCFSSRTEIVSDKYGRGERNATFSLEGRKDKIPILPVGGLVAPPTSASFTLATKLASVCTAANSRMLSFATAANSRMLSFAPLQG